MNLLKCRSSLLFLVIGVLAMIPVPLRAQPVDTFESWCAEWTPWLNRDRPSGRGDYEMVVDFQQQGQICQEPKSIQCQTSDGRDWTATGQVYTCDVNRGGVCVNAQQTSGKPCLDYRVRFCCQLAITIEPGVSEAERRKAIDLARKAMTANGLPTSGRMHATDVSLLAGADKAAWQERPGRTAPAPGKRVLVVHYRYEDSSAILSTVDLGRGQVTEQRQSFGYATDISPEEIQHARQQVLRHPEVRKILATVEGKLDTYIFPVARTPPGRGQAGERGVMFSFFEIVGAYRRPIPKLGFVHFDLLTSQVLIDGEEGAS